jgi:hypothetical protein
MTHHIPPVDSQAVIEAHNTIKDAFLLLMDGRPLDDPESPWFVAMETLRAFIQSRADPVSGRLGCPPEYAGPFFAYDFMPQKIMFKSGHGDTMALDVLSVRGWGHLTGGAALNINPEAAAKIQDSFGQWVVQTLNAALSASPRPAEGWRPIRTAPRDGTMFLAAEGEDLYLCQWEIQPPEDIEDTGFQGWYDLINRSFENPDHWMPLPTPPSVNSDNQAGAE